jgi:hypothetical protein
MILFPGAKFFDLPAAPVPILLMAALIALQQLCKRGNWLLRSRHEYFSSYVFLNDVESNKVTLLVTFSANS